MPLSLKGDGIPRNKRKKKERKGEGNVCPGDNKPSDFLYYTIEQEKVKA